MDLLILSADVEAFWGGFPLGAKLTKLYRSTLSI